jgi:uncharacterized protein (DUF934 family)
MAEVLRLTERQVLEDDWRFFVNDIDAPSPDTTPMGAVTEAPVLPDGRLIIPLSRWLAEREQLLARGGIGVWLAGGDDPVELADDLAHLPLIAVQFSRAGDGRGYSIAVQLRTRLGFRGELRAFGEVLRDQFEALIRCGFDALQPPTGRYRTDELEGWLATPPSITEPYQGAVIPLQPLFQRIARGT